MTLEPALLMSPCDGLFGMTRWPLCWIWSCVLLVNSFATGLTLVLDLELMPDVTGNLFLMVWWMFTEGEFWSCSVEACSWCLLVLTLDLVLDLGLVPVLWSEFGFEVGACCNIIPDDDVWLVVLYKVMMNYKIFLFYSGKFFYFLPNLIQVFWIMILSHFHLISDFYCPKQTTHHTWAPVLGPHQSSTFLGGAHCTLRCPHLRSGLLRSMLQGVVLGPVQS